MQTRSCFLFLLELNYQNSVFFKIFNKTERTLSLNKRTTFEIERTTIEFERV